jgi:hypothetical protein
MNFYSDGERSTMLMNLIAGDIRFMQLHVLNETLGGWDKICKNYTTKKYSGFITGEDVGKRGVALGVSCCSLGKNESCFDARG